MARDPIDRLGAALARTIPGGPSNPASNRDRPAEQLKLMKGVITATDPATNTCTVATDGVNERLGVPLLYAPTVSDVVWVLEQPPLLLVLGPSADF